MATDAAGMVVWAVRYLPFGGVDEVMTDTGVLTQNLRFPGQWFQAGEADQKSLRWSDFPANGLHQNWMRDYDPTTGRYLQADPLGLVDGASVYGYARQSPVKLVDSTGLYCYSVSGTTTCHVPGTGIKFQIPQQPGSGGYFGPENPYCHAYDRSVLANNLDVACAMAELLRQPEPGGSNGASPEGTMNYANPFAPGILDALGINPVKSFVTTDLNSGMPIVVNITLPEHLLGYGYVVHFATPNGIFTFGEGMGLLQSDYSPFGKAINNVWLGMNQDIIAKCSCNGQ